MDGIDEPKKEVMMDILVYGTLRKGGVNNKRYLKGYDPKERIYLKGLQLWDLGPYPYVIKDPTGKYGVVCESYNVPLEVARTIDRMERSAGYLTALQKDKDGKEYLMWIMKDQYNVYDFLISHGDYIEYMKREKGLI